MRVEGGWSVKPAKRRRYSGYCTIPLTHFQQHTVPSLPNNAESRMKSAGWEDKG